MGTPRSGRESSDSSNDGYAGGGYAKRRGMYDGDWDDNGYDRNRFDEDEDNDDDEHGYQPGYVFNFYTFHYTNKYQKYYDPRYWPLTHYKPLPIQLPVM